VKQGYKHPTDTCHKCNRQVPRNWMIQHLKSECMVPVPRTYEAREKSDGLDH